MEPHRVLRYPKRFIVAGSRSFHRQSLFDPVMDQLIQEIGADDLAFITGKAQQGADNLIDHYAFYWGLPCFGFYADWDQYGKRAGMLRNREMREHATGLIVFWDQQSNGTKDMIQLMVERNHVIYTVDTSQPGPLSYQLHL